MPQLLLWPVLIASSFGLRPLLHEVLTEHAARMPLEVVGIASRSSGAGPHAAHGYLNNQSYNYSSTFGFPGVTWLPIGLEIEFLRPPTLTKMDDILQVVRSAWGHPMGLPQRLTDVRLATATHSVGGSVLGVAAKRGSWWLEDEVCQQAELKSPMQLTEEEAVSAVELSGHLAGHFRRISRKESSRIRSASHITVDAGCLKKSDLRLAYLLLIWENFDSPLMETMRFGGDRRWSTPLAKKSPKLLLELQSFTASGRDSPGFLQAAFLRHSDDLLTDDIHACSDWDLRPGWRNIPINVCHVLDIPCTVMPSEKNEVPKFGALEFRAFEATVGQPLMMLVQLTERLVQASCTKPLRELASLAFVDVPANNASSLLRALGMNLIEVTSAFLRDPFLPSGSVD